MTLSVVRTRSDMTNIIPVTHGLRPVSKADVVVWGLEPRFRTPHDFGE